MSWLNSIQNDRKPSQTGQISSASVQSTNELGFIDRLIYRVTKPIESDDPIPLTSEKVKLLYGNWSGILFDLAHYLIEDIAEREVNDQLILNVSNLAKQILLALGSVRSNGKQTQELDHPDFGKHLLKNLLSEFSKHPLLSFDVYSEQEVKALKEELKAIYTALMEHAELDKSHISNKPLIIQEALYPSKSTEILKWAVGIFKDLPEISYDYLCDLFVESLFELCVIQRKLKDKSEDPILSEQEGASTFIDDLVETKILAKLRNEKLSLEFPFLRNKENKKFLTTVINQLLSKKIENDPIIDEIWETIENQLKMAIKAIFAVLLTPTEKQTSEEHRNHLVNGILNRLNTKSEPFMTQVSSINTMDKEALKAKLLTIKDDFHTEAIELLHRADLSWITQAQDFCKKAWGIREDLERDRMIERLSTWEAEEESNPHWKLSFSTKAKALLEKKDLSWEKETIHFLKVTIYSDLARALIAKELENAQFTDFFPTFLPSKEVLSQLYHTSGELFLELHSHLLTIEEKGSAAKTYIKANIEKLPEFIESLLTGLIGTLEKKGADANHGIDVGYGFLNQTIAHLLRNSPHDITTGTGKIALKRQVKSIIENILMIIFEATIKENCTGELQAEEAFTAVLEKLVQQFLDGIEAISKRIEEIEPLEENMKKEVIRDLEKALGINKFLSRFALREKTEQFSTDLSGDFEGISKDTAEKLDGKDVENDCFNEQIEFRKMSNTPNSDHSDKEFLIYYQELQIKILSRSLISCLIPRELFNELLPPLFRTSNFWEMIADELLTPYVTGIYEKTISFRQMSTDENNETAKNYRLNPTDRTVLTPLINQLVEKLSTILSDLDFRALFQSNDTNKNTIDFSILNTLIGNSFKKNSKIIFLLKSALPSIIESILAFHLNSIEGQPSQERAANFIWDLITTVQSCYQKIDNVKAAWEKMDANDNDFEKYVSDEEFTAYCKTHAIPLSFHKENEIPTSIIKTNEHCKPCYIWVQENRQLNESMAALMDLVLPPSLWDECIPKQFSPLITREKLQTLLSKYLKNGYERWLQQKKLVAKSKDQIAEKEKRKWSGLGIFVEETIKKAMKSAAAIQETSNKNKEEYDEGTRWIKRVLQNLMNKENASGQKPIMKMAISTIYAFVGMLLSGDFASIGEGNHKAKSIDTLIPIITMSFEQLNTLHRNLKTTDVQFSEEILSKYLSIEGLSLDIDETIQIQSIPNEFTQDDQGKVILSLPIENVKKAKIRTISIDVQKFIYWNFTYLIINEILSDEDWGAYKLIQNVLTKELIAGFAVPYVEMLHQIQNPLQLKAKEATNQINKHEGLEAFIDKMILQKANLALTTLAQGDAPLNKNLPSFLNALLKDLLKTTQDINIQNVRETLIHDAVHLLFIELLKHATKNQSATETSSENIKDKLKAILSVYDNSAANSHLIATKIIDELFPEEVWNPIFEGFKDLVTRDFLASKLDTAFITNICEKIHNIKKKETLAMNVIGRLDRKAGLTGRQGGLNQLVQLICGSIDNTLDEYGKKEDKIFKQQPLLFNTIFKRALNDQILSETIKKSLHALVKICTARAFQPDERETPESHVLKLFAKLLKSYNAEDSLTTASNWLEELFPEDLRAEILPDFLFEVITPNFLAENLKKYVAQIDVVVQSLSKRPVDDNEHTISRLKNFVKNQLVFYKNPAHSRNGISGFGGMIKPVEGSFLKALDDDFNDNPDLQSIKPMLETFLNQCITQIITSPTGQKLLDKKFLAKAWTATLPMLKAHQAEEIAQYPHLGETLLNNLDPLHLKALGIELKQKPNESHSDFKQRIIQRHFELEASKLMSRLLFPNEAKDLPAPKIAQESIWKKTIVEIADQVATLTHRNSRIHLFLNIFGIDKKISEDLREELKEKGHLNDKKESIKQLFNQSLVTFIFKKVEDNLFPNWPKPLRWIAIQFAKIVFWLAAHLFINRQIWNFIADPNTDEKLRKFIWKFLSFTQDYVVTNENPEELYKDLGIHFKKALDDMGLLKGLRKIAGPKIAKLFEEQNFVDLLGRV